MVKHPPLQKLIIKIVDLGGNVAYQCAHCKRSFREDFFVNIHVKNRHPEDLHLLYKVPVILNSFTHVEKSITQDKQTKQNGHT